MRTAATAIDIEKMKNAVAGAFGGACQAFGCFFAVSVMMGRHCAPVHHGPRTFDARRLLGPHGTPDGQCPR